MLRLKNGGVAKRCKVNDFLKTEEDFDLGSDNFMMKSKKFLKKDRKKMFDEMEKWRSGDLFEVQINYGLNCELDSFGFESVLLGDSCAEACGWADSATKSP